MADGCWDKKQGQSAYKTATIEDKNFFDSGHIFDAEAKILQKIIFPFHKFSVKNLYYWCNGNQNTTTMIYKENSTFETQTMNAKDV